MTNWECPICGFDTQTDEDAIINGDVPICPDCDVECGIIEADFNDVLTAFMIHNVSPEYVDR